MKEIRSKLLGQCALAILSLLVLEFAASNHAASEPNIINTYERQIPGHSYEGRELLVTGQYITPLASPGARYQALSPELRSDGDAEADGAYTTALSPDGKTLLVLTNGYNANDHFPNGDPIKYRYMDPFTGKLSDVSSSFTQWVFVYDVSSGVPEKQQQISINSAYAGIAWEPGGSRFYVSGGQEDRVYVFKHGEKKWEPDAPFILLGHNSDNHLPKPKYDGGIFKNTPAGESEGGKDYGLDFGAMTVGVAVSADSTEIYAVNMQNDSVSVIDAATRKVTKEIHLFEPGSKVARGEYPMWVTPLRGSNGKTEKLYVTSVRDGQVIAINLVNGQLKVIELGGAPTKTILSADGKRLFAVNPDLDEVDEINTDGDSLSRRISVQRAGFPYRGANPNSLALGKDPSTLYVTLGGENAIAVIDLNQATIKGRIPTAWYPTSVSLSKDYSQLYVVNFKSTGGPALDGGGFVAARTDYQKTTNPTHQNQQVMGLLKSALVSMPIPNDATLSLLSAQVDSNNHFDKPKRRDVSEMMKFLNGKIKHVIYIMKENRSYDQILGDLPVGNGDPRLALFGKSITPNHHKLAEEFTTLDNFYVPNESSGDGWAWVTQGHGNEYITVTHQFNDGSGFQALDFASILGVPREQNVALPETVPKGDLTAQRSAGYFDPSGKSNILPGSRSPAVTWGADKVKHDDDDDDQKGTGGYLWDSVLRAGLSVRHYGLWTDSFPYYQFNGDFTNTFFLNGKPTTPGLIPVVRNAFEKKIPQAAASTPGLAAYTDPYYRGWDLNVPDEYRYEEWKREFDEYVRKGDMPSFMPMLMMMDHTGNFNKTNAGGLNTPEEDMASNDHAIGLLVSAVSKSPFWKDTAIFIVEDDAYDGPDHLESHRIPAYVISAYTKRKAVVSKFYNTSSVVRTIADILGVDRLGLNDELAESMDEVFTTQPDLTPYEHVIPGLLLRPTVDPSLVPERNDTGIKRTDAAPLLRDQSWWSQATKDLDFGGPDNVDTAKYNRVLWRGIKGDTIPYPKGPTGEDLSQNRSELLKSVSVAMDRSDH
ncbi:MAG: hypothetical protein JSR89_17135 [Proteobacteria bacterium]|nr:hypothetical protein [Pseudomonadota bacterium]